MISGTKLDFGRAAGVLVFKFLSDTRIAGALSVAFVATMGDMALDERSFFTDQPEMRQGQYPCPKCRRTSEYSIRWVRRSKKDQPPPGADETDRAKFSKLRDYLLRLDDDVTCKTCGKRFEIPSQHSLLFVDQLAGLPNDEELEAEIRLASGEPEPEPEAPSKPALPARFTRKLTSWR